MLGPRLENEIGLTQDPQEEEREPRITSVVPQTLSAQMVPEEPQTEDLKRTIVLHHLLTNLNRPLPQVHGETKDFHLVADIGLNMMSRKKRENSTREDPIMKAMAAEMADTMITTTTPGERLIARDMRLRLEAGLDMMIILTAEEEPLGGNPRVRSQGDRG